MKDKDREEVRNMIDAALYRNKINGETASDSKTKKKSFGKRFVENEIESLKIIQRGHKPDFNPEKILRDAESHETEEPEKHRFSNMFRGKKKKPMQSLIEFREFINSECDNGCHLCEKCEKEAEFLIKNAAKRGY